MRFARGLMLTAFFSSCLAGLQIQTPVDRENLHAIELAQGSLRESPDSEGKRVSLASLYLKAGRNQDAVQILQEYLQAHPSSSKALRVLAVAYLRKEDYEGARQSAERALRLGPRDSAGVQLLAMAQLGLQATDAAERLFVEALKLDANSAEANFQLGLLYTKQRRNLPEATGLLEKARTLQPNLAGVDTALGSAFLAAGNARDAVSCLEAGVKQAPNNTETYYLLASAYRHLQQDEKAEAALAVFNARSKADADQRAREMRSQADYQEGVNLLSNSDQLDKAYNSLAKAANELPTFDPAYYRMAQVGYLKGDLAQALVSIREAIRLNPLEPEYYFVLARCLEDSDPRAALEAMETAVSLRPGVKDFDDVLRELRVKVGRKPPA